MYIKGKNKAYETNCGGLPKTFEEVRLGHLAGRITGVRHWRKTYVRHCLGSCNVNLLNPQDVAVQWCLVYAFVGCQMSFRFYFSLSCYFTLTNARCTSLVSTTAPSLWIFFSFFKGAKAATIKAVSTRPHKRQFRGSCISSRTEIWKLLFLESHLLACQFRCRQARGHAIHMLSTKENQHEFACSVWAAMCLSSSKDLLIHLAGNNFSLFWRRKTTGKYGLTCWWYADMQAEFH